MSETNAPETTTPRFGQGETVTVSRGKYRGMTGTVLNVDSEHKQYAVQLAEGLKVLAFSAVKPKQERVLTAGEFARLDAETESADALLARIEAHFAV